MVFVLLKFEGKSSIEIALNKKHRPFTLNEWENSLLILATLIAKTGIWGYLSIAIFATTA